MSSDREYVPRPGDGDPVASLQGGQPEGVPWCRQFLDSLDTGFCVLEVLFDAEERPIDLRFVEVNPAFERQTGLGDPTGKWVSCCGPVMAAPCNVC